MSVRYVVVRLGCQDNDRFNLNEDRRGVPEAAFADRAAADADRDRREQLARRTVNPWRFAYDASTLANVDEDMEFAVWLLDLGVPLPAEEMSYGYTVYNWFDWWRTADLTDDQRAAVWNLLDKLRFYDVIEVPLEE